MATSAVHVPFSVPRWLVCLGFIALCNATGLVSSLTAGEPSIYRALALPTWAPPPSVFAPVWTTLYTLMGIATFLVWDRTRSHLRARAMTVFAVQLALNFAWTPVFFGLQQFGLAVFVIVLNLAAVIAMALTYYRRVPFAALLVVPLIAWVGFATALNIAIWSLNR
jgi:benzodiazapine receptor